jgi:hypothetical protein
MSRSGYADDYTDDDNSVYLYRGAVESALRGRRGQAFLKEMLAAMDALPEKKLIAHDLEKEGAVCAIGSVGKARGLDMSKLDPEDPETVAATFGIAPAMAREIVFENDDEWFSTGSETPEHRFERVRRWIESKLAPAK